MEDVAVLEGGLERWQEEGGETVKGRRKRDTERAEVRASEENSDFDYLLALFERIPENAV